MGPDKRLQRAAEGILIYILKHLIQPVSHPLLLRRHKGLNSEGFPALSENTPKKFERGCVTGSAITQNAHQDCFFFKYHRQFGSAPSGTEQCRIYTA